MKSCIVRKEGECERISLDRGGRGRRSFHRWMLRLRCWHAFTHALNKHVWNAKKKNYREIPHLNLPACAVSAPGVSSFEETAQVQSRVVGYGNARNSGLSRTTATYFLLYMHSLSTEMTKSDNPRRFWRRCHCLEHTKRRDTPPFFQDRSLTLADLSTGTKSYSRIRSSLSLDPTILLPLL